MRLERFIVEHTEPILSAWEAFARTILPDANADSLALRDHAIDLLAVTVRDMQIGDDGEDRDASAQSGRVSAADTLRMDGAPEEHAIERLGLGFNLMQLVSEYGALRASVLAKWHESQPGFDDRDVEDEARFHASIDHSLATSVRCYTKRLDESRDMFLAILSHDLRNPLSAIAMSAQALPRVSKGLDPKSNEYAVRISNSAKVMSRMISDLLDYTRTRLGAGMPIDRQPGDLAGLAREVVDEFRSAHPGVVFTLRSGDHTGCDFDRERVRQVFSNLLGNAVQHGDKARPIEVTLADNGSGVTVDVRNRGRPIPPAEIVNIFDPLVRGAGTATPRQNRPGSIGLGLYIARELIHAHGGTITVTSDAELGSVFTFHIPR
jgi:signal transduction histidine kinase